MERRTIIIASVATGAVALVAGASGAIALSSADDDEAPITGPALERATAAALEHTGGGQVTETEVGDEDSYYEVEVTLDDGTQVDVQLDEDFAVVGSAPDDESEEEGDRP